MAISTAIAIYFLIWWITLFAVLPWGVRSQAEHGEIVGGTDPGAPALPRLGRKLLWTTFVSTIVFLGYLGLYNSGWITMDDLVSLFGILGPPRS